jgi:hypothetical protein
VGFLWGGGGFFYCGATPTPGGTRVPPARLAKPNGTHPPAGSLRASRALRVLAGVSKSVQGGVSKSVQGGVSESVLVA